MMNVVERDSAAVTGHKQSTVVPGAFTGEAVVHELTDMDLAMKAHYLRIVYYFGRSEVTDGLTITRLKEPMFTWLEVCYPVAGRLRRAEAGRPAIKCNDCGVRIVEAACGAALDEWLAATEGSSRWRQLVPDKVIGPDLQFSPLVYIQFTKFKCGGLSIGYSWAHVLGDAVSATSCINLWARLVSGHPLPKSLHLSPTVKNTNLSEALAAAAGKPRFVKQIETAGDYWVTSSNDSKMTTCSIRIPEAVLRSLHLKGQLGAAPFELISAVTWRCLARLRAGIREPRLATICRHRAPAEKRGFLSNEQKISTVALSYSPAELGLPELATLIAAEQEEQDESREIEGLVDGATGKPDLACYGANLTFVDMVEGVDMGGLELKGQKPVHVDCGVDGVGDEGAVLVYRSPADGGGSTEITATLILPEDEIEQLKGMLIAEFMGINNP